MDHLCALYISALSCLSIHFLFKPS